MTPDQSLAPTFAVSVASCATFAAAAQDPAQELALSEFPLVAVWADPTRASGVAAAPALALLPDGRCRVPADAADGPRRPLLLLPPGLGVSLARQLATLEREHDVAQANLRATLRTRLEALFPPTFVGPWTPEGAD